MFSPKNKTNTWIIAKRNLGNQLHLRAPCLFCRQDKYTVWDTLTSSLCAIVHDNLPLELLNQPFHFVPEALPLTDPPSVTAEGTGNGNASPSSPAWMDTARSSSDEVRVVATTD